MTFDHANLGSVTYFVPVPFDSPFNSLGNGQVVKQPRSGRGGGGNGGGPGGGPSPGTGPNPSPGPTPFGRHRHRH
jgi:hypothetical protein